MLSKELKGDKVYERTNKPQFIKANHRTISKFMLSLICSKFPKYTAYRNQRTLTSKKMQPSIKMFFKAKDGPTREATSRCVDKESDNENKDDSKSENSTPLKRPAEDDDNKSNGKRQAITSQESATPVKVSDKNMSQEQTTMSVASTVSTPSKDKSLNQETKSSPLMNINIIIRKTISSGAFALHENIGPAWFKALQREFDKPYFKKLSEYIQNERKSQVVYPPPDKVFSWTHHHDIRETKAVILGQDPYHGPNQAHGLSFSVQRGIRAPPSLINIFKELENDIPGFKTPSSGDLTGWAKQGVLMLNACLTVRQSSPNSHQNKGWETFTDAVITWISKHSNHKVVFLLWGRYAQKKSSIIDKRHKVLTAAHPSPLSVNNGFFGCKHFSQTNDFHKSQGMPGIDWKAL